MEIRIVRWVSLMYGVTFFIVTRGVLKMTLIITMYDNNDNIIEELFADDWSSFAEMMGFYFSDKNYFRFEVVEY